MSGPKYGQILLGKIRRAKIMKELDAALEERERKSLFRKQEALQTEIDEFVAKHPTDFAEKILNEAFNTISQSVLITKLQMYLNEYSSLKKEKCLLKGDSKTLLEARTAAIERFFRMGNLADLIGHTAKQLEGSVEKAKKLAEVRQSGFSKGEQGEVSIYDNELDGLYNDVIDELSYTILFAEAKLAVDDIMNNPEYDTGHKKSLLKLRLDAARVEKNASSDKSELTELTERFESLSAYLGKSTAAPEGIYMLRDAVSALEKEAQQYTMGEYISESLQSVMERLGYDIIGGDTVVSAKHETQKDYYEFSETSFLNVSTNEEGAVLFEVVGRSDGEELSYGDKLAVKDDMDKFCPDYQRVKDLLAEYDLTITDERTCEADVRYVRSVKRDAVENAERRGKKKARRMSLDE